MRNQLLNSKEAIAIASPTAVHLGFDNSIFSSGTGILEWLDEACQKFKDRIAIECSDRLISYSELDAMANRVANGLIANQLSKGAIVAVILDDRIEAIATLIGILRSGNAFVPLDPEFPEERLGKIVADLSPDCLITQPKFEAIALRINRHNKKSSKTLYFCPPGSSSQSNELDLSNFSSQRSFVSIDPDSMCYIYYTSGSTGTPKGIAGRLKAISHFIKWEIETFNIATGWRVSQFTQLTFDAFLRDVFVPLCVGGTICIPPDKPLRMGTRQLVDWIDRQKINLIHCVPSVFGAIASHPLNPQQFQSLHYILMAGEILPVSDVKKWMDVYGYRIQLVNLYGATETTMVKFYHPIQESDLDRGFIPIGKPMRGARAIILNECGQVCPPGIFGELYVRTPYQTLGYYNNSELTKQVFVKNPFSENPNDIIYKTGDLARILNDGTFQLSGRRDNQVKIRGIRVELGEIENQLRQHPLVKNVVVEAREDEPGNKRVVAYLVTDMAGERVPFSSRCTVEWEGKRAIALTTEDISTSGVCLRGVPDAWKVGQNLRLHLQLTEVSEALKLEGNVLWRHGDRAGILLQTTQIEQTILCQNMKRIAKTEGFVVSDFRRSEPRVPLATRCWVEFSSGVSVEMTAQNLSRSGIRLVAIASNLWKGGDRIGLRVQLPGVSKQLQLKGTVTWHSGKNAGIVFDKTPEEMLAIAQSVEYLVETQGLSLSELRSFLKEKLPDYAIPSAFVLLDTLPFLSNGKVDRRSLPSPDENCLESEQRFIASTDPLELQLTVIWQEVLGIKTIGIKDNFFELGGHSLLALRLFDRIEKLFGKNLPLATLFQAPTIEQLASILRSRGWIAPWRSLVAIQPGGSKLPFFCVHGVGGGLMNYYNLARHLHPEQPFYGLQALGLDGKQTPHDRVEDMAAHYIQEIRTVQPEGPYLLGGHCSGGVIAFEMAQQLRAQGEKVGLVAAIDSFSPALAAKKPPLYYRIYVLLVNFFKLSLSEKLNYILERIKWRIQKINHKTSDKFDRWFGRVLPERVLDPYHVIETVHKQAFKNYIPQVYPGQMIVFRPEEMDAKRYGDPLQLGWGELVTGELEIQDVPGNHTTAIAQESHLVVLAAKLQASLDSVETSAEQLANVRLAEK